MNHDRYDDSYIRAILKEVKTIALVGGSANTVRPSFFVLKYLLSKGYNVVPVNPAQAGQTICGVTAQASLSDISGPIDMVDIFRSSRAAGEVVDQALALPQLPKVIWMQLTVRNDEAAGRAEACGLRVVMNRCPKIEYARLCGEIGWAGVSSRVITSRKPKLAEGIQRYGIAAPTTPERKPK
jgi:uncharacterized protein